MPGITVVKEEDVAVRYLRADCGVRYWEDAVVNGLEDAKGDIPLRRGDSWCPVIDLESGTVLGWPAGVTARVHYKVCDAGVYALLDADMNVVAEKSGYVPEMMCPAENGYGDYVIMDIDGDGKIDRWRVDLSYWKNGR